MLKRSPIFAFGEMPASLRVLLTPVQRPNLVKYLLGRMVAAAHPQAIWLFGSRAGGDARPDSDFDLLAVFPDDDALDLDTRRHQLADAVMGAGIGTDIAVCTASEFAACHDMAGSLIRTVHEPGREVYAAPAERRRRREPA